MTEQLQLVSPSMAWERQIVAYRKAFKNEHMHGGAGLPKYDDIPDWLDYLAVLSKDKPADEGWTSSAFLTIRQADHKMVGICNVRHHIASASLRDYFGHIGYSIHPDERRKGYAKEQLRLALVKAKQLGIDRVLITCSEDNRGSEKTILANGGIYEDSRMDKETGDVMKRYWIDI